MGRISFPERGELDDAGRQIFDAITERRGKSLAVFRAMMHSPRAAERVADLGAFLRYDSALPELWRELAILAVAAEWGCDYEWDQHEPLARAAGADDETIVALEAGAPLPESIGVDTRRVVACARQLTREGVIGADLLQSMRETIGERSVVELTLLVGYYGMLSGFLRTFAIHAADDG